MPALDPAAAAPRPAPAHAVLPVRRHGRASSRCCARSCPRAGGEGRRVALVGGEAGSGKSRLVREFAHEAARDGALVLYGACDAVVRTPYRPFVEALDQLVRIDRSRAAARGPRRRRRRADPPAARPAAARRPAAGAGRRRPGHRAPPAAQRGRRPARARRRRRRPLLSCSRTATGPTRRRCCLLRHLSRAAADARMLLVATFRDTEADMPAELSAALVDLRRSEGVVPIRLAGLTSAEIAEFVGQAAGRRPGRGAAATGGVDPRPDRGQRVPRDRAVAGADRDRSARRGRRARLPDPRAARSSAAPTASARS